MSFIIPRHSCILLRVGTEDDSVAQSARTDFAQEVSKVTNCSIQNFRRKWLQSWALIPQKQSCPLFRFDCCRLVQVSDCGLQNSYEDLFLVPPAQIGSRSCHLTVIAAQTKGFQ